MSFGATAAAAPPSGSPAGSTPDSGAGWTIQTAPYPSYAKTSWLTGVSCTARTHCVAVGYYTRARAVQSFSEIWDGGSWRKVEAAPEPAGILSGVSCVTVDFCMAVGRMAGTISGANTEVTLAELWNGTSWSTLPTPNPAGATSGALEGVSCTAADSCMAVGVAGPASPLAEQWNGATWTAQTPPKPAGSSGGGLVSVSCTGIDACMAVGAYQNPDQEPLWALGDVWNGTSWALATPTIPGASESVLISVSCAGASCTAVGYEYDPSSVGSVALAEQWNGAGWSGQGSPRWGTLYAVSCPSAATCTAVGNLAKVQRWNGTAWINQKVPSLPGTPALHGVSCALDRACAAVGLQESHTKPQVPLAEGENGA